MENKRHVGRVRVGHTVAGRAALGRAVGRAWTPERAPTDVMKVPRPATPPVFVDPSGARRRRVRRIAYGLGALLLLVLLVLWLSQIGGLTRTGPAPPCPSATAGAAPAGC